MLKRSFFILSVVFFVWPLMASSAVDRETFENACQRVQTHYAPIFARLGLTFIVESRWDTNAPSAGASREGSKAKILVYGGLARHSKSTKDAIEMVICHEIGHHLGGAPKITNRPPNDWASIEGEADYYAYLKCARELWAKEDNQEILLNSTIPSILSSRCKISFSDPNDYAICVRSVLAGLQVSLIHAEAEGRRTPPRLETPDTRIAIRMVTAHPTSQCRLDTFFAGAVCARSKDEPLSNVDSEKGACSASQGDQLGVRPQCWFVSKKPMPTSF